jgi:RES domain-containing protein
MTLYRIVRCNYADLSGTGSRLYGGRWNGEGRLMVYLASSRSLAMLESLAHLSATNLPDNYCLMIIEAPDDFIEISLQSLPQGWKEFPEPNSLKHFGNDFLLENKHLFLKVPSAIISEEHNYLMNPLHPKANEVKIISSLPFRFDPRLIAR